MRLLYTKSTNITILSLITLLAITALACGSSASAVTDSATASVTVPDACTISGTNTTHTATVNGGSYTTNVGGLSTVSVVCNDRNGYSVYAVGYSDDTEGTTTLIGTSTGRTIPTGTSTDASTSNWAMMLSPVSGTYAPTILSDTNGSYSNYHVIPSSATKVATYTGDIAYDTSTPSQFTASYAVAIASNQAADTYVGKVKYTVVHPNYSDASGQYTSYNVPVTFAGEGVENVTFTATGYPTRTVSTSGSTANLIQGATYTVTAAFAEDYKLDNWALNSSSYGVLGSTSTNPTSFTPNTNSGSAIITITGKSNKTYMQDLALANCSTDSMTVYDKRDETPYIVKKLADGNCWMTENLALDLTALSQAELYGVGADAGKMTNASNTSLGYLKNGGGTTSDQYPTARLNNVAWTSSSQNYYSIPMMVSSGNCYDAYCVDSPSSGKWAYNATLPATVNGTTSIVQGKIGIYYNFCAASAGSYCYGNGTSQGTSSGDANQDICPYGWHIPSSGPSYGQYHDLLAKYKGNNTTFIESLSLQFSGYFESGSARSQGQDGDFWSSSRNNDINMRGLYISDTVFFSNYFRREYGNSIRCVKDN